MLALRRNTFVVPRIPSVPQQVTHESGMDKQNLMRLKVNRIALVQELRVEHILSYLKRNGIVSEQDCDKIKVGSTPQNRARILIDILPTKGKDLHWYKCFRDALLNPEDENSVKDRYRNLVEFLDNTVIHRPLSRVGKFSEGEHYSKKYHYPRYKPLPQINEKSVQPDVLNLEIKKPEESEQINMDLDKMTFGNGGGYKPALLVKGFFHQWIPTPDNFRSLLELPSSLQLYLKEAGTSQAAEQLHHEQTALHYLQQLEVVSALDRHRQLPSGFELCMCDIVQEILAHPHLYHLCLKHVRILQKAKISILKKISASYDNVLKILMIHRSSSLHQQVVVTGFRFADLLIAVEMWQLAEEVLFNLVNFLKAIPTVENWIAEYNAHLKLMAVQNDSCDLEAAQRSYFAATQMASQIQMVSSGRRLLFEGGLHQELSTMFLEYGSIQSAYGWSRRALREVNPEDSAGIVEVLTQAVMSHSACWQIKKAESLAIYATQFAMNKFGKYHPLYLKALNSLSHVCSEFTQDVTAMLLANDLLEITEKLYNCETLQLAVAHHALSKAHMSQQDFCSNDCYYTHAMEAVRIARSQLPDRHVLLHRYLANFALALQWKSLYCPKEVKDSTLRWAETEARQAHQIVVTHFGDISLKSAQIHILLGQIYYKMNRLIAAEKHLATAVDLLKLCQPASSKYLLLAHANLGIFLNMIDKHDKAIYHLKQVVMLTESTGYYLKWVHDCFQTLITLLQTEGAAYANSEETDFVQLLLSVWLKDNPKDNSSIDINVLNSTPSLFQDFLRKFDTWGSAVLRVQNDKDSSKGGSRNKTMESKSACSS